MRLSVSLSLSIVLLCAVVSGCRHELPSANDGPAGERWLGDRGDRDPLADLGPAVMLEGDTSRANSSGAASWTHNPVQANLLLVEVAIGGYTTVTSATCNSGALSALRADPPIELKTAVRTELWYTALNPPAGPLTIQVTLGSAVPAAFASSAWRNVDTTSLSSLTGDSAQATSVKLTQAGRAGDVLRGVVVNNAGMPNGPFTWSQPFTPPPGGAAAGQASPISGTASLTWTLATQTDFAATGVLLTAK